MNSGVEPIQGQTWVEGGIVRVKNPGPGGKPAAILPCPGIEILVSGRKIAAEEPVAETTPLQINLPDQSPSVSYKVQTAKGGLEATVTISLREGVKYALADLPPSERLVLKYTTTPVPAVPDLGRLLEAMKEKGVVIGVDEKACAEACKQPKPEPCVVAVGEPVVPGKNGEIQFLVPMERIVDLPPDVLQIDFRETVKMPDVKARQVIAIKRDPLPGAPGKSVTGASIPPPRPKDPHFRAGKGVEIRLEQNGLQSAVAAISGCPMFSEESGVISVEPVMTYKGDVDLSSGNVRSSGGLNILGGVAEGMKVECEGNQEIAGKVTAASLKAWGSIKIRDNVFKSTVTAGKDSTWVRTIDAILKNVEEAADGVLSLEAQMKDVVERKTAGEVLTDGDAQVVDEEAHLERFRGLVIALLTLYKENLQLFPKQLADRVRGTRDLLAGFGTTMFEKTHSIMEGLSEAGIWIAQELMKGKSDVVLPYAQSSTIEASRDIIVSGQGVFYCNLLAGRAIKVVGSPGLVRGGEARARELVQVNAAGGQGAAPTLLAVSRDGKIQAQIIYPNTVISVGRLSFRTENTIETVKAAIQGNRLLVVTATGSIEVQ
jgi:hypothetical protein